MLMKSSSSSNPSEDQFPLFNGKVPKSATKILFTDEKAPNGAKTVDLTSAQDGDVIGWLDGTTWKISTQDSKKSITFNTDSSYMFSNVENIKEIQFNNIDTSQVKQMEKMFLWCRNLENLDLNSFDTSHVVDMSYMFNGCENLKELDLSSFNTSNVIDMCGMFHYCYSLTNLNLSNFDTKNVKDMVTMFEECSSLTNLNINNWNVSKVGNMASMFSECKSLTTLNLGDWKTSSLNHTYRMFCGCSNLETLDLSNFDTTKIGNPTGNMTDMFQSCYNLKSVKARSQTDIDNFKTKNTHYWTTKFVLK